MPVMSCMYLLCYAVISILTHWKSEQYDWGSEIDAPYSRCYRFERTRANATNSESMVAQMRHADDVTILIGWTATADIIHGKSLLPQLANRPENLSTNFYGTVHSRLARICPSASELLDNDSEMMHKLD